MPRPRFIYRGEAVGLGWTRRDVVAGSCLPVIGGCSDSHAGPFPRTHDGDYEDDHYEAELGRIISYQSAASRAWGGRLGDDGPFRTEVTASLDGFNLLEGLLSWRSIRVALISQRELDENGMPMAIGNEIEIPVTLLRFEGLRLFGYPLEVELNSELLGVRTSTEMDALTNKTNPAPREVQRLAGPDNEYSSYSVVKRIGWKNPDRVPDAIKESCKPGQPLFQGNRIYVNENTQFYFGEVYRSARSVRFTGWRGEFPYPPGMGERFGGPERGTGAGPEVGTNGMGSGD